MSQLPPAFRERPRWFRWALLIIGFVVGAPIALDMWVRSDSGQAQITELVHEAIRDELGLHATLGSVHAEFELLSLDLEITVDDFLLDHPEFGRAAEARQLRLRPSLTALLQGTLDLHRVDIEEPTIRLVVRDGRVVNLPDTDESQTTDLPFHRIVARRATLVVDAEPTTTVLFEHLSLDLEVSGQSITARVLGPRGRIAHARGVEHIRHYAIFATIDPGASIRVDEASIKTDRIHVTARNVFVPIPFDPTAYYGDFATTVDASRLKELGLAIELPHLSGHISAAGQLVGSAQGPIGRFSLNVRNVVIEHDYGLGDMDFECELQPQRIVLRAGEARLVHQGGSVDITGTIGLTPGLPVDMTWNLQELQFANLMDQIGVSPDAIVDWTVSGPLELRGTLDPLDFGGRLRWDTANFRVTDGPYHASHQDLIVGVPRARVTGWARVDADALRFERLALDTGGSHFSADVYLGFDDRLRTTVTSSTFDASDASPLVGIPIGGRGSVDLTIGGTYDQVNLSGHVTLGDFSFNNYRLGDIDTDYALEHSLDAVVFPLVRAEMQDSRYQVENLRLDFAQSRFQAAGLIRINSQLTLADFFHAFHLDEDERYADIEGAARGTVALRYTHGFPGDGPSGSMLIEPDLFLPWTRIFGLPFSDGRLLGRWDWQHPERDVDGAIIDVHHLHLRQGSGTLTAQGHIGLGGQLDLTATVDQFSFRETAGLHDELPQLGGSYGVVADIGGTLDVPRIDAEVGVAGVTWKRNLLGDGRFYVRLTDREDPWVWAASAWDPEFPPTGEPCPNGRLGLARGRWPSDPPTRTAFGTQPALRRPMAFVICGETFDGRLSVDMAIGRARALPLRGLVQLTDFPLAPLFNLEGAPNDLDGRITGHLRLSGGGLAQLGHLDGQLKLQDLQLRAGEVEIRNDDHVDISLERGELRVRQARFVGARSRVSLTGGGHIVRGLDLRVEGRIDLGLVGIILPRVRHAAGHVEIGVQLEGPFTNPRLDGRAVVRDASFVFANFDEPIHALSGDVLFRGRQIEFRDFTARAASGQLALRGTATLQGRALSGYRFEVQGNDLRYRPEDGVLVGFYGSAALEWNQTEDLPLLSAVVNLDRFRYSRSVSLSPTLGELYRPQRTNVSEYDPEEDQIRMEITIREDQPIQIDNNLFTATVHIDDEEQPFRIVGTDQRYGVLGRLRVGRGVLRFRNSEFELDRGVVSFDDPNRVDPRFDLLGVTELRRSGDITAPNWRITLRAHGDLDSFRLDATSDPEASQEDILLLLTVGLTRAEAEQLQAGDVTSTVALEALAQVTGVDREIRRRIPVIDDFSITSVYSPSTHRTEPQITIGKRITERIRVTASRGVVAEEFRAGLEWQVGDQTSFQAGYDNVNTDTSSFGNVGLDVRWRLEFD